MEIPVTISSRSLGMVPFNSLTLALMASEAPTYKLFNLSEDPYEKNDLSKTNQQKAKELFRLMVQRLEKEQALYPVDADKNVLSPIFVAE